MFQAQTTRIAAIAVFVCLRVVTSTAWGEDGSGSVGSSRGPDRHGSDPIDLTVEAEEIVFSDVYSNSGSTPMWCYGNTLIVRLGEEVFVSATESLPQFKPLNDCRWVLMKRTLGGWTRQQADEKGRQREPCLLGCLPPDKLVLSSNPTLLGPDASGGGPARPELVVIEAASPKSPCRSLLPGWNGNPRFNQHSYRAMGVDAERGEVILFQDVGLSHAEWALLDGDGQWTGGRLNWPPYAPTDLSPYGARHPRVHYGQVVLQDRAVHYSGCSAYDNWDRVRTYEDMNLGVVSGGRPPGMVTRQRGNRSRKLYYTWTDRIGEEPFHEWIEIDNTFADGGWLFPGDMYLDAEGSVHLLWYRGPMLRTLRDKQYPDIRRVYSIEYALLREGKVLNRCALVQAGEGHDGAVPTDLDRECMPYVGPDGGRIVGDPLATPRFHITPDGRLFVVYYVTDGAELSENRILEIEPDGTCSAPATIPLKHPLTQFFTATPRAGCAPSWTLDLFGHRRGDWRHREGSGLREYEGTLSYAQVRIVVPKTEGD
jgi:hypothetical protein